MALESLKKKKDFEVVFKRGKSFREGPLFLKIFLRPLSSNIDNTKTRFGIIISQKVSKKATIRNKIKRRIKHILTEKLSAIKPGFDLIIIPFSGFERKDFLEMKEALIKLLKKAHLLP